MCKGTAGPHLRSDPDRFHDFLISRLFSTSSLGVASNAVGALGDVSHRNGDELLITVTLKQKDGSVADHPLKFKRAPL